MTTRAPQYNASPSHWDTEALYEKDATRPDCPACQAEDGGCPGHCPVCDDPVDYCQGHSPSEIRILARTSPVPRPNPFTPAAAAD